MRKSTTFARLFREQGSRKAVKLMSRRKWKYPAALEHQYARSIKFYLDKNWKSYAQTLIDSYVPARMDALEDIWPEDPTRGPVLGAIVTIAENMEKFNQKEWDAFKKIAVGAAFSEDDGWTQAVVDEWARTQVTLITKASNDMRDAVARRVRKGVAEGQNNDEIKALIMRDLPGISTRRAAIIARDQTAKLNADLSKSRMEQAGIETYIWSTSMDERVRGLPGGKYANSVPSHYLMEGLICRWDDPTKYRNASGEWVPRPNGAPLLHPGQDILCRCVALPNWGELDELTDATPEERAQTELEMAQEALQRAQTAASYVDPSNPAYKEFERATAEAQKFLDIQKNKVSSSSSGLGSLGMTPTEQKVVERLLKDLQLSDPELWEEGYNWTDYDTKWLHKKLFNTLLNAGSDWDRVEELMASGLVKQAAKYKAVAKSTATVVPTPAGVVAKNQAWSISYAPIMNQADLMEQVVKHQGYDGLPHLVDNVDDFKALVQQDTFFAMRVVGSDSEKALDEYRQALYHGDFYVRCGNGHVHGYGMYAGIDLTKGTMKGLQKVKGIVDSYSDAKHNAVEFITLKPGAKVIRETDIISTYIQSAPAEFTTELNSIVTEKSKPSMVEITESTHPNVYAYLKKSGSNQGLFYNIDKSQQANGKITAYVKDVGVLASELGYDAIITEHNVGVVLNRSQAALLDRSVVKHSTAEILDQM